MDRRVKERLIGASILVALIVLVVPELLSGPKPAVGPPAATLPAATPEPLRNVTVDLSTSKSAASPDAEAASSPPASAAIAAPAARDVANPAAAAASPAPPNLSPHAAPNRVPASPAAAAGNPRGRPAVVESAARSPISATRAWSVQLGSFASRANADNLARQLRGQGFSVYVAPGGSGSAVRYRVRVGPLANRESAERTAAKLKTLGHVSSLVSPGG